MTSRPVSLQPHLTPAIIAAVMGAGALHAGWNAIAKQVRDRLMAFAWIAIASAIAGGLVLSLTGIRGLLAGLLCVVAYGVVLWAQTRAPLAEVAAIRETSLVFGALIGLIALGEDFGKRRVAAALVIAAGIVLIGR